MATIDSNEASRRIYASQAAKIAHFAWVLAAARYSLEYSEDYSDKERASKTIQDAKNSIKALLETS